MKYGNILVLATVSLMAFNAFGESEMDSEINDLQVRIIHVKPPAPAKKAARARPTIEQEVTPKIYTYAARPAVKTAVTRPVRANFYKPSVVAKPTYVATNDAPVTPVAPIAPVQSSTRHQVDNNGNTNNFQPAENYQSSAEDTQPEETVRTTAPKSSSSDGQFVRRLELIPSFTISSFDGDSSLLQPSGVSNTYNSAPSVSLLADIDFGSNRFFIESGFMLSQMGAGTGLALGNGFGGSTTSSTEKEALTYIGVPLNLKFRLRDQEQSSFFIKAGGTPVYMISHNYTTNGTASTFGFSPEQRFGAYNTFDLLLDAGVGYDLKVFKDFHAVIDISAFQGLFPVLTNFNVLNYGVNLGLGIGYML